MWRQWSFGTVAAVAGLEVEQETITRRDRRGANRRLLGLLLIGVGTVWFLEVAHLLALSAETLVSGLLLLLGVGLVATARRGRGAWPLVLGGLLTVALILNSPALTLPSLPGFGDQHIQPAAGNVQRSYNGGVGDLTLDLTRADPQRRIAIRLGIGDLTVLVPTDAHVTVVSQIGVGQLVVCGDKLADGFAINQRYDNNRTGPPLWLVISNGIGAVRVEGCKPAASGLP